MFSSQIGMAFDQTVNPNALTLTFAIAPGWMGVNAVPDTATAMSFPYWMGLSANTTFVTLMLESVLLHSDHVDCEVAERGAQRAVAARRLNFIWKVGGLRHE